MGLLNQSRFPRLWLWFQYLVGGCCHKQQLAREHYDGGANVLEVGCSVGNLARGFAHYPDIKYTGVDIDAAAINSAQRAFRRQSNFQFVCGDVCAMNLPAGSYDYVILSAMLHHIDDAGCRAILGTCANLLSPTGTMVVTDPVWPAPNDPWLVRFFNRIEQGEYVRQEADLLALLNSVPGLTIKERRQLFLAGSPLGFPRIARCGYYCMARAAVANAKAPREVMAA
jgi:SAM-dependent methyltransferase